MLRPGERISQLITELAAGADAKIKGFIFVRSDLPIYSSSLFGSATVLANIPPQLSPEGFAPDAGLDPVSITPPLAIVQPSGSQSFQAVGLTGEVTWLVNDIEGGNPTVGTIDANGQYTAPTQVPLPRVVTVAATAGLSKGGASVDVLEKEQLFTSTDFVVQSVAYLGSLQNLYTAELAILSSAGEGPSPLATTPTQITNNSEIFEIVPPNVRTSIIPFDGEKITKIIPFTATNGKEFLLLAAQTSGKVIRLDPVAATAFDVATGLNQPTSLVIDTSTGNLLVAEQDKVTIIPRADLEAGLLATRLPGAPRPLAVSFPLGGGGVARDRCSGDIYTSDALAGVVRRFDAKTQQVSIVFSGLQGPGQLLALYRSGISCPDGLQLLLVETGLARVVLLTPSRGLLVPWFVDIDSTDVSFLVGGSGFTGPEQPSAILLAELLEAVQPGEGGSTLGFVGVPDLYGEPDNEPTPPGVSGTIELTAQTSHFAALACPELGATVDVTISDRIQLQGELSLRDGVPVITGTLTENFTASCDATGAANDCDESVIDQGTFEAVIQSTATRTSATDVSGTWSVTTNLSLGKSQVFEVEVFQTGNSFSGDFLFEEEFFLDQLPDDAIVTCSSPGNCSVASQTAGPCSVSCSPATPDCAEQWTFSGTVTPSP